MKKMFFIAILILSAKMLLAQGDLDNQSKAFYRNEQTMSFGIRTNGFGFDYMYAKRLDGYKNRLFAVDLSWIKHEKEKKTSSIIFPNSNRFVYGKLNTCYSLKAAIGLQKEIFSKRDKGAIAIRYFYLFGPSLGILKPIFYDIYKDESTYKDTFRDSYLLQNIIGPSSYFKGMDSLRVSPGAFVKAGMSFEYSKKDKKIRALEAGFLFDVYFMELPIMSSTKNSQFLFSLYIKFRLGRIVGRFERAGKDIEEIFDK